MKKLIEISSGNMIYISETVINFGGVYQDKVNSGIYKWLDVPANEDPNDCVLDNSNPANPVLIVDSNRKTARLAKVNQLSNIKQAINTVLAKLDVDITAADIKTLVVNFMRKKKNEGEFD